MTFNSSKIASGLTVLSYHMPYTRSVAINLIVRVGGRYESTNETGISHFLEHMAFKGTSTRTSKMIAEEFDAIGGHFNAYTGKEQTVYFAKVLDENFENALEIIADIIQNSSFNKEDIDSELQVILQEIAGVQDNPDELVYEKFYSTAYPAQSLGTTILGTHKTLDKFDPSSFRTFLSKYYTTENMFLSVAGNVDHEKAARLASELFSSLKPHQKMTHPKSSYAGGYNFIQKDLEQTTMVFGFESIAYTNLKEFYHAQILSLIFGGGISSRLFQHIRETLGLAYSVGAYNNSYSDTGLFSIYASTAHEKLPLLIDNLVSEIKNIKSHILPEELERAKKQIKINICMAEEKSAYKSEEIGKNYAIFGRYHSTQQILDQIFDTTLEDVKAIAAKIFSSKPTLSIIGNNDYTESKYLELCQNLKV